MPVGEWATFGDCEAAQRRKGHSATSARRICGWIEHHVGEDRAEFDAASIELEEALELRRRRDDLAPARGLIRTGLARIWNAQGSILARLARAADAQHMLAEARALGGPWDDLLDQSARAVAERMRRLLRRADSRALVAGFRRGLGRAQVSIEGSFDLENPRAVAFMDEHGARFVRHVGEGTRAELRALLARAAAQGWSVDVIASQIRAEFRGFGAPRPHRITGNVTRAHVVAATETAYAYAEGNVAAGRQLQAAGLPMEKRWLPGPRTEDDVCLGNVDEGWIALSESFRAAGVPNPPAHPNCVCDVLIRVQGAA